MQPSIFSCDTENSHQLHRHFTHLLLALKITQQLCFLWQKINNCHSSEFCCLCLCKHVSMFTVCEVQWAFFICIHWHDIKWKTLGCILCLSALWSQGWCINMFLCCSAVNDLLRWQCRWRWLVASEVQPRESLVRLIKCLQCESEILAQVSLSASSYPVVTASACCCTIHSVLVMFYSTTRGKTSLLHFNQTLQSNIQMSLKGNDNSQHH